MPSNQAILLPSSVWVDDIKYKGDRCGIFIVLGKMQQYIAPIFKGFIM